MISMVCTTAGEIMRYYHVFVRNSLNLNALQLRLAELLRRFIISRLDFVQIVINCTLPYRKF